LLDTSIGRSVPRDVGLLHERAFEAAEERITDGTRAIGEVIASLEDLRDALELPRAELISTYRDVDDYLLMTLLDPVRRAAAEYACGVLTEPDADSLYVHGRWSERKWDELSDRERDLVRQALQSNREDEERAEEFNGLVQIQAGQASGLPGMRLRLNALAWTTPDTGESLGTESAGLAPTPDCALYELEGLSSSQILAFARGLGEDIGPGQEETYIARWRERLTRKRRQHELDALVAAAGLSPAKQQFLSSLTVPLSVGRTYALWELQEAVAAASGLNVVSDCFWQPGRPLTDVGSALHILASSCQASPARAVESGDPAWLAGWEWGDAGSFLRFRSINRALWRASLLPARVLARLDDYLNPSLPDLADPEWPAEGFSLDLAVDLPELFQLSDSLDDLELVYGGWLLYEDPADPTGACRHAVRNAFLRLPTGDQADALHVASWANVFRVMASLSPEQWELACGRGLRGAQMTEAQLARIAPIAAIYQPLVTSASEVVVRAYGPLPTSEVAPAADRPGPGEPYQVRVLASEDVLRELLSEGDTPDSFSLCRWFCPYRLSVHVPRPLRPAEELLRLRQDSGQQLKPSPD